MDSKNQFLYMGRWVDKNYFSAFVYDKDGNKQLAPSYEIYIKLTQSGLWFDERPELEETEQKPEKKTRKKRGH